MNVVCVSGPPIVFGAERVQVDRAEARVLVADLREARADVLVGAGDVAERPRPTGRWYVAGGATWNSGTVGRRLPSSMPDTTLTLPAASVEVSVELSSRVVEAARDREVEVLVRRGGELELDAAAARLRHVEDDARGAGAGGHGRLQVADVHVEGRDVERAAAAHARATSMPTS